MDSSAAAGLGLIGVFIFLFGIVLAILWILVPFAIFGVKGKLDTLIGQMRRNNELLEYLTKTRQHGGG